MPSAAPLCFTTFRKASSRSDTGTVSHPWGSVPECHNGQTESPGCADRRLPCTGPLGAVGIEPTTFGLKGRCSTTELRPYMRLNILHGNKFAGLGGIEMSGEILCAAAVAGAAPIRRHSRWRGFGTRRTTAVDLAWLVTAYPQLRW